MLAGDFADILTIHPDSSGGDDSPLSFFHVIYSLQLLLKTKYGHHGGGWVDS